MKKLLVMLLTVLMFVSLTACAKKEEAKVEEPTIETQEKTESNEPTLDGPVAGGWTVYDEEPESQTSEEGMTACEKALEGLTGVGYRPYIEMGTQVVSGKNYMYLSKMTTVVPNAETELGVIVVYANLQGGAELLHVNKINLGECAEAESEFASDKGLVGGWQVNENLVEGDLPEGAKEAFDKCTEGLLGVNYTPITLLGTQVVAGTNYAVLALRQTVTPDAPKELCIMYIYADLKGNASLSNVYALNLADFNK